MHSAPTFAGDTVYARSEILDRMTLAGEPSVGALRVRTVATKDLPCRDFLLKTSDGKYESGAVLDFDYSVLMPRRV